MTKRCRERNIRVQYLRKFEVELDEYLDQLEDELSVVEEREYLDREVKRHEQLKALRVA